MLPTAGVDALVEVAGAIEQPDAYERDREIGRLLHQVAREDAKPSRVHRKRRVHPELSAHERHRRVVIPRPRARGTRSIAVDERSEGCDASLSARDLRRLAPGRTGTSRGACGRDSNPPAPTVRDRARRSMQRRRAPTTTGSCRQPERAAPGARASVRRARPPRLRRRGRPGTITPSRAASGGRRSTGSGSDR